MIPGENALEVALKMATEEMKPLEAVIKDMHQQEETVGDIPKLNQVELIALFGNFMPMEVATLLLEPNKPLIEVRKAVYDIALTLEQESKGYHKSDNEYQVCFYEQEFYPLSNFSSFMVEWKGIVFPTLEHAYHWEKYVDAAPNIADVILKARSAHDAFKIGGKYKDQRRQDWDDVRVDIMEKLTAEKLKQHGYVRKKLMETRNRILVEDSWRDDFWGWGPNKDGQNWLGRIWMKHRTAYREMYGEY